MKFKAGDRVKIRNGSFFCKFDDDPSNPLNTPGTVDSLGDDVIYVVWDNGELNTYEEGDLVGEVDTTLYNIFN